MVGNGGIAGKAMIQAGYSPVTANMPSKLTQSQGFQELLAKNLPEKLVTKRHKQLLNKKEVIVRYNHEAKTYETIKTEQPHSDTAKAIDMAYKLRGSYAPEKHMNLNASLSEALDMLNESQENKAKEENTTP